MPMPTAVPELCPGGRRYKIRFPDQGAFEAAASPQSRDFETPVTNAKRRYRTLALPRGESGNRAAERRLDRQLEFLATEYHAEIESDPQYDLDFPPGVPASPLHRGRPPSLDDVLDAIHAREAWRQGNRGQGANIAVVDTGVDGRRLEFPDWKRRGSWQTDGDLPFTDPVGHGTMCAVVAAGTRSAGGRFEGVAPEAGILACRTRFFDSELAAIYDHLIGILVLNPGMRLIATNSFGHCSGKPLAPVKGDFPEALAEAIAAGVGVFFSAGNNHDLAGGRPQDCHPSTIWDYKTKADVFTVGACDLEGRVWDYSSRGPGQGWQEPGNARKPDCVAPTPRDGLVGFGVEDRSFAEGWGTSGASPQAAGLAALLWTAHPSLTPPELFERIRQGARDLGIPLNCQGSGQLDCAAACETGWRVNPSFRG